VLFFCYRLHNAYKIFLTRQLFKMHWYIRTTRCKHKKIPHPTPPPPPPAHTPTHTHAGCVYNFLMTHKVNSNYFSVQNTQVSKNIVLFSVRNKSILKHYLEEHYGAKCQKEFYFNAFIHVLQNWKSYLLGTNTQPQVPLLSHLNSGYILIFYFILILSSHQHRGFKIVSSFWFSNK
jgi:hypothetical protein